MRKKIIVVFLVATILLSIGTIATTLVYIGEIKTTATVLPANISSAVMGITKPDAVEVGEEFIVTIYIDPSEVVGGWEIYAFNFTQGMVNAIEVMPGDEWNNTLFDPGNIDNENGTITEIQTWTIGPSYNHTACEIYFEALQSGLCTFTFGNVDIMNETFENMNVTTIGSSINITEYIYPTAEIGMSAPDNADMAETFEVDIYIDPSKAVDEWEIDINFTKELIYITGITSGTEWPNISYGYIDNINGTITNIQSGMGTEPDYNHTAFTLNCIALQLGSCIFEFENIIIVATSMEPMNVTMYATETQINEVDIPQPPGSSGGCSPYTINGYVSYQGIPLNNAVVLITNNRTGESITYDTINTGLKTYSSLISRGFYQGNLGNMQMQWLPGDLIYVNATFYGIFSGSANFNIPSSGSLYSKNIYLV